MDETTKYVAIAGASVATVLVGQWAYNKLFNPTSADNSLLTRGVGSVATGVSRVLSPGTTGHGVKVGFPRYLPDGSGNLGDGSSDNNSMRALQDLARDVLGSANAADVALSLASCECMTGPLAVSCYSCSLFNIHYSNSNPAYNNNKPGFYLGSERLIDFLSGEPNQVAGFRACLVHFRDYMERRSPGSIRVMENRDFDEFQRILARLNYAPSYVNAVQGNTVSNPFLRARWNRLVSAGLVIQG